MSGPAKVVEKTEEEQRLIAKSQYRGKLLRLCLPYLRRLPDLDSRIDPAVLQDLVEEIERELPRRRT